MTTDATTSDDEKAVRELLTGIYLDAGMNLWLSTPNPRLPGTLSPHEAIAAGLGRRVIELARKIAGR